MTKKRSISIIALSLALILSVAGILAACNVVSESNEQASNPQELKILDSGYSFTQDQVLSRIKAQNLIKNNGYLDSDEVVALVTLGEKALIDSYNQEANTYDSIADFAESTAGSFVVQNIDKTQTDIVNSLKAQGLIGSVKSRYSTLLNAIAVETTYGKLAEISKQQGVLDVSLSETYNLPQTTESTGSSAVENIVDIYPTGIYNSASVVDRNGVQYTGKGTAVAILDSGFDCSHEVFQRELGGELVLTREKVQSILSKQSEQSDKKDVLNAVKNTAGISINDVYVSDKIPFVYDYADKDIDVFPYDSEHGTHVAGIIGGTQVASAGNEKIDFTGVAVDTQLVLMKVFPDLDAGGRTEDILEALEDAVMLGVDAINMSLGSSCGFTRMKDGDPVNAVYDKIKESGISLLTAASNSYSSGFGGDQGNTNFVTNPDSGTVGSPSTYEAALSVASISGVKSNYIVANPGTSSQSIFFYNESNSVTGDPNEFVKELKAAGYLPNGTATLEYVTVPGVGLKGNYSDIDVKGKIALVKRGDNSFEEKAMLAKRNGAIACIIYNNVDGDILMSMGKTEHIPTISVSKDVGTALAKKASGKLTISENNLAGPFMSDFSSWGPTPDLKLKPEITAHGGDIYSAVPNKKYDRLSGTSMATPNLCGVMVLIREYLKDKYPEYKNDSAKINEIANQMLMSTATIALNEEGVPYSPRKQGAGLASASNVVKTNAYLTVNETIDGTTSVKAKSKIELGDDPERTGVYTMEFNVVNISAKQLTYNLSVVAMSESVSTSDANHVAETGHVLGGDSVAEYVGGDGSVDGNSVTVQPGKTVTVKVTYTLSQEDKDYIDELFLYGMYVEGFVCLRAEGEIDLNVPFLAYYGDWTEPPMFDKTYYEVEADAHNKAIDDEDKTKADYWATTPYGSYYYNYLIPLGTYLYSIDENKYDPIPASEDHIAVSNILGAVDGISAVYAGMLRNAKAVMYTITDKTTGEPVTLYNYETGETMTTYIDYNASKAYSNGGSPYPSFEYLRWKSLKLGLINNHVYEFKMQGLLDYGDGGLYTNARNTFSFDFTMDDQAPVITGATYEKVYDKSLKKDRYYVNLTIYDNHYVMSVTPILFNSSSSYTFLTENPIPVYGGKNTETTVRIEITDYLEDIFADQIITSALAFSVDDYALNSNIFLCQLPGTNGELKFTQDGMPDGEAKVIMSMYEGEVADVSGFVSTTDKQVDTDRSYMKYLTWSTSNDKIISVKDGIVKGLAPGKATVTASEALTGNQAVMIVNVKARSDDQKTDGIIGDASDAKIKSLRFSYFDTVFAYSRAAQTSEIGATGDRKFLQAMSGVSMYPGEQIKLSHDFEPWYAESNYDLTYVSDNPGVATVDKDGKVTALKQGVAQITLKAAGSSIQATVAITVKSEFVIENRMLVAYKGLGGNVVIPDDEGILYIGSYAFCLYTTDNSIELSDEDYDANKIPASNTTITSVVVPEGVTEIQKYAFYNCKGLREVAIPKDVKIIREFAFYNCQKLERIVDSSTLQKTGSKVMADKYKLDNGKFVFDGATPDSFTGSEVETIGAQAFYKCKTLNNVDLSNVYAVGDKCFDGCESLTKVNLTSLRNTGVQAFQNCTSLSEIVFDRNGNTKLGYAMFANSGLTEITLYNHDAIPTFCFANSSKLTTVNFVTDCLGIGKGAFSGCTALTTVNFDAKVDVIGEQAFYQTTALTDITLPDCQVALGSYSFLRSGLTTLGLGANTVIVDVYGPVFRKTKLANFVVDASNANYIQKDGMLVTKDGKEIVLAPVATGDDVVIDASYQRIGKSAFAGSELKAITFQGIVEVGDYAFVNCQNLTTVTFADQLGSKVGVRAFNYAVENSDNPLDKSVLGTVNNLDKVTEVAEYAFSYTAITSVKTAEGSTYGEGAFYRCASLVSAELGANSSYGMGCFQNCTKLSEVTLSEDGGITVGQGVFANDRLLEKVNNFDVLVEIPREAFFNCQSLKTAVLSNAKIIGDYAFADCKALKTVEIPVVETIGTSAFGKYDIAAPSFTDIVLPSTLKELGEGAFISCDVLAQITIPSGFTKIPQYAFTLCTSLKQVVLPDTVTEIGNYAFMGCSSLADINLDNVVTVGTQAFYSCTSLENVNFSSLVKAGEGAFSTTALKGVVDTPELTEIVEYAFQKTAFSKFNAPKLQILGEGAFNENTVLTEFAFTDNIKKVDSFAFLGCTALTKLLYNDGENVADTAVINDYAKVTDGVLYVKMANGYYMLSSVPAGRTSQTLVVDEGTRRVDAFAGNQNKNITFISLPDSMRSIGFYAFYGCTALKTVEFRSVVAPALDDTYNANSEITETDKGYNVLHPVYNLFGFELYYYNFVDLVGKIAPLNMIVPKNKDISGYDSLVYRAYFGDVNDIDPSLRTYEATEQAMVDFIDGARQILAIDKISLADDKLVSATVLNYRLVTQDPFAHGVSVAEWDKLVQATMQARDTLFALKAAKANQKVKKVQAMIDSLPSEFSVDALAVLKQTAQAIKALSSSDRALLDQTNYTALTTQYENYCSEIEQEASELRPATESGAATQALAVFAGVAALAIVAKKKIGA